MIFNKKVKTKQNKDLISWLKNPPNCKRNFKYMLSQIIWHSCYLSSISLKIYVYGLTSKYESYYFNKQQLNFRDFMESGSFLMHYILIWTRSLYILHVPNYINTSSFLSVFDFTFKTLLGDKEHIEHCMVKQDCFGIDIQYVTWHWIVAIS